MNVDFDGQSRPATLGFYFTQHISDITNKPLQVRITFLSSLRKGFFLISLNICLSGYQAQFLHPFLV